MPRNQTQRASHAKRVEQGFCGFLLVTIVMLAVPGMAQGSEKQLETNGGIMLGATLETGASGLYGNIETEPDVMIDSATGGRIQALLMADFGNGDGPRLGIGPNFSWANASSYLEDDPSSVSDLSTVGIGAIARFDMRYMGLSTWINYESGTFVATDETNQAVDGVSIGGSLFGRIPIDPIALELGLFMDVGAFGLESPLSDGSTELVEVSAGILFSLGWDVFSFQTRS